MLRIVPHTVPRVGRSYEHFPDGFELHLLPFSRFFFCPIASPLPLVLPLPATLLVRFSYPSATSSREGMIGPGARHILPSVPPLHLLLPLPPPQPLLPPRLPLTTLLPSLSRPVLEQSGAPPL